MASSVPFNRYGRQPQEVVCRIVSTSVVAVVVPILTLRPTLKLCHVPSDILLIEPGGELLKPRRCSLNCTSRMKSSPCGAENLLKSEMELIGFVPAFPDEFLHQIDSTELICVIIVNAFDMTYFRLEVALDRPVVKIQDEMCQRPFIAEDFIDRAHCGGVVGFHRQEAGSAGVCQEVPCHYQKDCLGECLKSCNDAVTFDATLVSKTGRFDFPFRREVRDIELE